MCGFQAISPLISETVRDNPMVAMERYNSNKSQVADRSVSVPTSLSDLERWNAMGQIFQAISLIRFVPFELERPNSAG